MSYSPWLRLNSIAQNNLINLVLSDIKAFTIGKKGFIPILHDRTFLHSHNLFSAVCFARSCMSDKIEKVLSGVRTKIGTFYVLFDKNKD